MPAYTYSPRIRNPFRIHSRNVRNVFVICVLHIRRVKVWFLCCKSMVFGVQKGGFCIAKVWFLFFECCVVAICQQCYWQSVRSCRGPIYRAGIYEHPQNGIAYSHRLHCNSLYRIPEIPRMALQFASFRHIKTIWGVLKNGHDEATPMPYVLFVAIHLRNKWILRIVRCCIFCTINKWYGVCVGVFIDVHLRCLLCE